MESVEEVKRKKKGKESRYGNRYGFELKLRCVKLRLEEGLPVSLLSKELGVSKDVVYRWVKAYQERGEEGLRNQVKSSGGRRRLPGPVREGMRQQKVLWQLSGRPLPKEVGLRFRAETNVKPPYEVKWQVVNTGTEAFADNGLRGEFYEGSGSCGTTRWESTQYRGTHWIEAFVIKNGICVARSGLTYVRIR